MAALIIETSQGGRHDTQFHRVETFPFRIGRAYDNDLILADDTVSPHHLIIEQSKVEDEGEERIYCIRNLSSENGTFNGDRAIGEAAEKLNLPLHLTLGRSHLKFLSSETSVGPTRHFPHASWLTRWASDLRVAVSLLCVYLFLSVFFAIGQLSLWQNWERVLVNKLLEVALPLLAATVIGFVSRILLHRWRFPLQLSIACIALGIVNYSGEVMDVISYWSTNSQLASRLSALLMGGSFIALLAWQLRAISTLSRRRAAWTSVGIIVPLFLIWELQATINQPDFQTEAPMHTLLQAADIRRANSYAVVSEFRQSVESDLLQGIKDELAKAQEEKDKIAIR